MLQQRYVPRMLQQRCLCLSTSQGTLRPLRTRAKFHNISNAHINKLKSSTELIHQHIPGPIPWRRSICGPFKINIGVTSFHSTCPRSIVSDPKKNPPTGTSPIKRRRILPLGSERENITNLPNILTVTRLVAAPVIGYLILHDQNAWAVGLLAYASLTDLVDGYVARRWDLQTVIGTVLDPLADKLLMTILTVCLAVKGALPIWIAGLILGKDAGLGIAAIYYRWISLPPPKTFLRYWDFSLPSAEVKPTTISKYNTALQLLLLMAATAEPLVATDISAVTTGLEYTVGTTTIWSALSYVYTKDAVRILPRKNATISDQKESHGPM